MSNLHSILSELRQQRDRLDEAITVLEGVSGTGYQLEPQRSTRRKMSAAGRRRIAAAQRARWAKVKARREPSREPKRAKKTRTLSIAARKRIAAAQKARWAKLKAGQKAA